MGLIIMETGSKENPKEMENATTLLRESHTLESGSKELSMVKELRSLISKGQSSREHSREE